MVILAYQFGGSRNHPRCLHAAQIMREHGIATLLCDLLTDEEEARDEITGNYHHDVALLARRLVAVTGWARDQSETRELPVVYYGVNSGGDAALIAAAKLRGEVRAVVSRDGRLDPPSEETAEVECPTLLVVGEKDEPGVAICRKTLRKLKCRKELLILPGASRLFGEPGKHEEVVDLSAEWLRRQLGE